MRVLGVRVREMLNCDWPSPPELIMQLELTAVYRKVPEGYVGFVEELPGANTQGATLEEARENLREAVELVLEANRAMAEEDLAGQDVIREPLKLTA
jgi:predicted RNase H-like HicB family nuclease